MATETAAGARLDISIERMTEHDLVEVCAIEELSDLSAWGWEAYHNEMQSRIDTIRRFTEAVESDPSLLQDLGFKALYPDRHRIIGERIRAALGNRREAMAKIEMALEGRLAAEKIPGRAVSRIKSAWSIYSKMRGEHKSFAQLMDVYGFRVITD